MDNDEEFVIDKEIFSAEKIKEVLVFLDDMIFNPADEVSYEEEAKKILKMINHLVEWIVDSCHHHYNGTPYSDYIIDEYESLIESEISEKNKKEQI